MWNARAWWLVGTESRLFSGEQRRRDDIQKSNSTFWVVVGAREKPTFMTHCGCLVDPLDEQLVEGRMGGCVDGA